MYATKTHERFLADFKKKREDADEYEFLSEYLAATAPIKLRHKICGTPFESSPTRLIGKLYPEKCPVCHVRANQKKSFEEIQEEIQEIGKGDFVLIKDDFEKNFHMLTIRHEVCGTPFKGYRHNIKQYGLRCPKCSPKKGGRPKKSQEEVEKMIFEESKGLYVLKSPYTSYSGQVEVLNTELNEIEKFSFITLKSRIKKLNETKK